MSFVLYSYLNYLKFICNISFWSISKTIETVTEASLSDVPAFSAQVERYVKWKWRCDSILHDKGLLDSHVNINGIIHESAIWGAQLTVALACGYVFKERRMSHKYGWDRIRLITAANGSIPPYARMTLQKAEKWYSIYLFSFVLFLKLYKKKENRKILHYFVKRYYKNRVPV